jgi:hypothetical protein
MSTKGSTAIEGVPGCAARAGSRRASGFALHAVSFHRALLADAAALITGRNHHSVGFGVIGALSTGSWV